MKIVLKELERSDKCAFEAFEKRYKRECGPDEVIPFSMNPKNLPFEIFFQEIEKCRKPETLPKGFVLAKYYLILNELNQIVGGINIRYQDNDFILNHAGHIGYGIAPWERNKGYAKEALKRMLLIAKNLGLNRILLTTNLDNIASSHVIMACGGVFEKQQDDKKFYWITLGDFQVEESAMALVVVDHKILSTKELIYDREVLSLPKGHVEGNETYIETAIRECQEETGIVLNASDVKASLKPFSYQFVDHHLKLISKTIYPILFMPKDFSNPIITEKRILSIQYLPLEVFLKECSYDNVRTIVMDALTYF